MPSKKITTAVSIQPSFAKGELGPSLYGRVDTAAYQVAFRTGLNMQVSSHGKTYNRAGLRFIAPCKDHTNVPQMIPFAFKAQDTYVIEVGNLYMRFIRNDAQVLEATKTITAITAASPAVVTSNAHGYTNGDHVYLDAIVGMTELNGRWFQVANKATNTFELTDPYDAGATGIDSSAYTAYSSGGTSGKVYEVVTTYAQADLKELVYTQSADTMTITNDGYEPKELSRTDHNAWTLSSPTFAPSIADPTGVAVTVNGADNDIFWKYLVTAVKEETFEESLAGINGTGLTVASTNNLNPVSVAVTAHGLVTGDEVEITGLTEMTEINDRRFTITKVDADNFTLDGEDGTSYTDESTGGANTCFALFDGAGTQASPTGTTVPDNTIAWNAVTGAQHYNIYRAKGGSGLFGFLDETKELTYTDDTAALKSTDDSVRPPTARNPFRVAGDYPGAVGYHQQRRVFGGTTNNPDTSDFSQTGNQSNFTKSNPLRADDAIRATLSSNEVNQIRHYVGLSDLLVLTDGSEWKIGAGDNSGFSADTLKQEPQTRWGASYMTPVVTGKTIIYVQENQISVRSFGYQLNIDGYTGTDLTLLAPHIFEATTAEAWGYTRAPDPVAFIVRSDGVVATMTFNEEQEVLAWTRWKTRNGLFKACTAIRPQAADVHDFPYFVVQRVINGNTVNLIERLASRRYVDVEDCFFVDSGLTLDTALAITGSTAADPVVVTATSHGFSDGDEIDIEGISWTAQFDSVENETNPDQLNGRRYFIADKTANTFTLFSNESGKHITAITKADPAVVTSPAHGFSDGDMIAMTGISGMTEANNNIYKVAGATTDTFELNTAADATVDSSAFTTYTNAGSVYHAVDGSAFQAYVVGGNARKAVSNVTGLNHLEGQTVMVLADGNVIADQVITGGTLATPLSRKASRVHVGLQMVADLETLDIEAPGGTIQGKKKKIAQVTVRFEKSRGLLIGPTSAKLTEMKQRQDEVMGAPTALLTGDKKINLKPDWNSNGRLLLRQVNPLPMDILAIIPELDMGD